MATNAEVLKSSTEAAQKAASMIGGTFKQGEGFSRPKTAPNTSGKGGVISDQILDAVSSSLLETSGMVSSAQSGLESIISEAVGATKRGRDATSERIESVFDREISYAEGEASATRDQFFEGRSGFATSTAALERLNVQTERSLRDLDQRKNELLLQNEAAAAEKITNLQIKKLEFQQEAAQQAFTNILSTGTFALNVQAQKTAEQQFNQSLEQTQAEFAFTQKSALTDLATRYGLEVQEGDTLESLASRAVPIIEADRKLDRAAKQAQIDSLKADMARVAAEAQEGKTKLQVDAGLHSYITGGSDAYTAALKVATDLGANQEQFNDILARAQVLKNEYDTKQAKAKAESTTDFTRNVSTGFKALVDVLTKGEGEPQKRENPKSIHEFLFGS